MKLPAETLLDSLRCLDRPSLDAVHISTKRFRNAVDKLKGTCLRFLNSAKMSSCYESKELVFMIRANAKRATPRDVKPKLTKKIVTTEEHAGERFADLIASSFVDRMVIQCELLTDGIANALQPVLPTVHVCRLFILNDAWSVCPYILVETLTSFGSIRDILSIVGLCKPGHVNDALLACASEKGTREVHFSHAEGVTDEGILNFLKAPNRGPQIRKLELCRPRLSAHFWERLVEAHKSGLIDASAVMNLWRVPHHADGPLRLSVRDNGHGGHRHEGQVLSFGPEVKLVKEFAGPMGGRRSWRQSIHYEGREVASRNMLQAESSRR